MILPADLMMKHGLHRSTVLKGPKCEEEMRALQDTVQARLPLPLPLLSSHVDTYIHTYIPAVIQDYHITLLQLCACYMSGSGQPSMGTLVQG